MEPSSDSTSVAVRKCPFLAKVAAQNGTEYAKSVALCPTGTVGQQKLPEGQDAQQQYERSFELFHGPSGIVPLVKTSESLGAAALGCPFHAAQLQKPQPLADTVVRSSKPPTRPLPLATISLSFGSGASFGDFFRKQHGRGRHQPNQRHQQPHQPAGSSSPNQGPTGPNHGSASHPSSSPSNTANFKPQRPLTDPCTGSGGTSGGLRAGPASGHGPQPPCAASSAPTAAGSGPTAPTGRGTQFSSNSTGPTFSNPSSGRGWSPLSGGSSGISSLSSGTASSSASPFKSPSTNSSCASKGSSSAWGSGTMQRNPATSSSSSSGGPAGGPNRPNRQGGPAGRGAGSNSKVARGSSAAGPAPQCPLRKWLGPMAGLVFNEYDKLVCPPPIVAARAALAKTAAVQQLRPQKLPVKLVAVAAVAAASNMPCGAVREHFEKFSVGWFIAVHATIPFVAMLRKAVIMPKFAMLVTFTAAIMGQMIGSRLERARLQQLQQQGLQDPLTSWLPLPKAAVAAAAPATAERSANSSSKAPVRNADWHEKLLAGGKSGFADEAVHGAAAAAVACGSAEKVVGLGSFLPQLPVVRA